MKLKSKLLLLAVSTIFTACTTYQKSGFTGGYEEKEIEPRVYDLYYYFNGPSALFENNLENWHKRAAELCGGKKNYDVIEGPEQVLIPQAKHGKIKCKS